MMNFTMPFDETLEIRPSKEITLDEECDIEINEEIEGLEWLAYWNGEILPWSAKTKGQMYAICLGCQWGAMHTYRRMNNHASIR